MSWPPFSSTTRIRIIHSQQPRFPPSQFWFDEPIVITRRVRHMDTTHPRRVTGICHRCQAPRPIEAYETRNEFRCAVCGDTFVEVFTRADTPRQVDTGLFSLFDNLTILGGLVNSFDDPGIPHLAFEPDFGNPLQMLSGFMSAFLNIADDNNLNNVIQHIMANDPNHYGPPPAAREVRKELPRQRLTPETAVGDCAVCQESFKAGDLVTRLTRDAELCAHMFHDACLMPWLQQHNTCPICRYELPTDDADYERRKAMLRSQLQQNMRSSQHTRRPQRYESSSHTHPPQRVPSMRPSPLSHMAQQRYTQPTSQPRPSTHPPTYPVLGSSSSIVTTLGLNGGARRR
eukprot:Blabericola_migrator_1__2342@NODE_1653_length_4078_cov_160_305410_g1076_i0_p1_GENE_NODE_1653_length_4078_cov_160_305410_g1076_i0NODE_1653_length_4078_cov_160_305410_g1076_i0_p1_ORF_typecomplete_len351_score54_33zfRING_2/PF13639_6/3_2e02zfRING_2/PF13639_6/3_3e15zfrbx1/PF12678_7/1_5e03zfrbx1/PF12678_7/7_8e09zfC3HC4_2/PF13923_6/5_1e02zfC3HC4_2/PF13923_6/3_2e08ProkRING_4/PF14447_6/2_5e03ProkRING_4/PF14447_6/3_7e07zfANAPC11/PF12861_7/1_9e03zfANAPC11/PF12861_7/2_9e03zfANAPC11/PF12861_7/6_7e07FANCL_C/P